MHTHKNFRIIEDFLDWIHKKQNDHLNIFIQNIHKNKKNDNKISYKVPVSSKTLPPVSLQLTTS